MHVQAINLITQSSPVSRHFLSLRPIYSPQYPFLKHPQSVVILKREKPSFTPTQRKSRISVVYFIR